MVPTDGTVINHNVPGPQGYCIPLQKEKGAQCSHTHTHTHTLGFHAAVALIISWATGTTKQESLDITFFLFIVSDGNSKLYICSPTSQTAEYMNTEINVSSFNFTFSYSLK